MWWRMALPIVFMFAPGLIQRLVRTAHLVWKLSFDRKVPLLLKLLVPATLIYFLTPVARVPYLGPVGYALVLWVAVSILLSLAPRDVVEFHAPWRARGDSRPRSEKGPERVVEGSYRLVDDDKPPNKSRP